MSARGRRDVFERTTSYEAAYIARFPTFDEDAGPAIRWAAERARERRSSIMVVAPTRRHFKDNGLLAALPASVLRETPQTLRFHAKAPVVVAFWPTARDLDKLDGLAGVEALAVVPWLEDEIETWRRARAAIDLLGDAPVAEPPVIADPVVKAAMRSLTSRVNLSSGLSHPMDRSAAIQAFKILVRNGHRYDPQEVQTWAMANGWAADDARRLSDYAEGVLNRKAYRVGRITWREDVIELWRSDASD